MDADEEFWGHWIRLPDGSMHWVWREVAIDDLLVNRENGRALVAGASDQCGRFDRRYDDF